MFNGAINGAIRGAIIGAVIGLLFGIGMIVARFLPIFPAKKCDQCGAELPKNRKPADLGQLLGGTWSCPKCGCKLNVFEKKPTK